MRTLQDLVDAIIKRDIEYNMLDLYLSIYFTDVLTSRWMGKTCEKVLDAMKIKYKCV